MSSPSCVPCQQAEESEKLEKLRQHAKDWAKEKGLIEAIILEGPNGYRYPVAVGDERAKRLKVIEIVSIV